MASVGWLEWSKIKQKTRGDSGDWHFLINFLFLFWVAGIWWCLKSVFHKTDFFFSLLRQGCFNSLLVLWRFQGIFGFCTLASWPSILSRLGVVSQGKWICKALLHLPSYEAVGRFIDFHDFTAVFFAFAVKYGLYDYVLWFGKMIKLHDFDICFLLTSKWLERNYWIVGWNVWLVVLFPKFFGEVGAKCPASEKFYNMSNAGSEWPNAHNPLTSSALMIANLEMLPSKYFIFPNWSLQRLKPRPCGYAYAERPNRWKQRKGF